MLKIWCFLLCIFISNAVSAGYLSQHHIAYGMDIGGLQTQFKEGYGANFFADYMADYNFFISTQRVGKFGFEGGFSLTSEEKDMVWLFVGDSFPGSKPLSAGQWQQWQSSITVTAAYFAINWYGQMTAQSAYFVMAGAEITRMKINIQLLDTYLGKPEQVVRTFSQNKVIPVWKMGLQYTFTSGWGLRFYYAWRYYTAFNPMKSHEYPTRAAELQLDNSNSYYLGIYAAF